jgi:hypothetical protein
MQTCVMAMPPPPSGTPACALVGAKMGNMYPWSCAIRCGMMGATNYGACPAGLSCTAMNICD